jgi:hypothetical protein
LVPICDLGKKNISAQRERDAARKEIISKVRCGKGARGKGMVPTWRMRRVAIRWIVVKGRNILKCLPLRAKGKRQVF